MTISDLTGIPRPTVLRKLNKLIKTKWISKDKKGLYKMSPNEKNYKDLNEMRLDENQKERLRSVNGMFDVLISGLRKDVKRMRLEIELEKINDDIDDNKIYGLYDKIADTQAAIWKETFKKEQEIKFILNERQLLMHEKIRVRNQRDDTRLKPNYKRE